MGSIPPTLIKTKNPALWRDFLAAPFPRKLFLEKILGGNLSPPPRQRNHFRFPVKTFVPKLTRKSGANLIITLCKKLCQIKDLKYR